MDIFVGCSGTRIPGRATQSEFFTSLLFRFILLGKIVIIFTNLNGSVFASNSQSVNNDKQKRISTVGIAWYRLTSLNHSSRFALRAN